MLRINNLSKSFHHLREDFKVIKNISTSVADGEFITIFGPNGAGKSTFLYLIAGLDEPSGGEILYDKTRKDLSVGCVFQNYNDSLLPWKTILDNVALPLRAKNVLQQEAESRSRELLQYIGLGKHLKKYPYQLSGGLKQLTAIARAFAMEPDILLLDEPSSSLDYSTTRFIQTEIVKLWEQNKKTTICVSHDPDEAIFLADRILIFSQRPSVVKEEIIINLPRPRTFDMLTSEAFLKYREKVLRVF